MTAKIENHRCASLRLARRSLATPVSKNRFLLRSASLPPQHAQHRRALGTPTLRVGLRRKEGLFAFATQHLRASVCAKPTHTGSTCWAIIFHPSGVGLSQSELCFRILK